MLKAALPVLLALSASPAMAEDAKPLGMQDVKITSDVTPEHFVPTLARIHGVSGAAKLNCLIGADGSLTGCSKVSEKPVGMGYLDATRRLARVVKVDPLAVDGSKTSGRTLIFEMRFDFCHNQACEREARIKMLAAGREP